MQGVGIGETVTSHSKISEIQAFHYSRTFAVSLNSKDIKLKVLPDEVQNALLFISLSNSALSKLKSEGILSKIVSEEKSTILCFKKKKKSN